MLHFEGAEMRQWHPGVGTRCTQIPGTAFEFILPGDVMHYGRLYGCIVVHSHLFSHRISLQKWELADHIWTTVLA